MRSSADLRARDQERVRSTTAPLERPARVDDCVICAIAGKRTPARVVYEDETIVAFIPPRPVLVGHIVIALQLHVRELLDVSDRALGSLLRVAKTIAARWKARLPLGGVNILMASGAAAQQSVPHLHLHLIPRMAGDGVDAWPQFPGFRGDHGQFLDALRTGEGRSISSRRRARSERGSGSRPKKRVRS
jgi:histidine triad (HIT) family protein